MESIEGILRERDINYLCHFTKVGNLESIFRNGLYPRCDLYDEETNPDSEIVGIVNDQFRYDNHTNASCLSISFPNSSMFFSLRCQSDINEWAVIFFKASVLVNKICMFCPTNAASSYITSQPDSNFQGVTAFQRLFLGSEDERASLLPKDPTDVQAEVLVFDVIEPNYIAGCVVGTDHLRDYLSRKFPGYCFRSAQNQWDVFDDRLSARKNNFIGY